MIKGAQSAWGWKISSLLDLSEDGTGTYVVFAFIARVTLIKHLLKMERSLENWTGNEIQAWSKWSNFTIRHTERQLNLFINAAFIQK